MTSLYNTQFILVCLSSLLFSASFNMLIPELPSHLSSLGGAEYKGFIIALFTLTAGLSRPFSGKLTDTIGRVPVMAAGSFVCFVCGFLYPMLTTVSGFLFLRLLHGFSTGFKPTATAAFVADITPSSRWGEALGIHGLFFGTGLAIGPAIGSTIRIYFSLDALFYSSSFLALLSILILFNTKESLIKKEKFKLQLLKISRDDILDYNVLPAAIVTFLSFSAYGVLLTLIPDWSEYLGIKNKGLFFMVLTIASLVIRFVAGKTSDIRGRIPVIKAGLLLLFISLIVVGFFQNFEGLMIGAVIYGVSTGILSPALNAWTVDLSSEGKRGKALATMYIAMEAGIGGAALLAGWYYQDVISHIPQIMFGTAGLILIALAYMYQRFFKKP